MRRRPELTRSGVLLFLAMAFSSSGNAPNFAPIANIKAERDEVFPGQAISFSGEESIDPDDGPKRLSFSWDFGDGATSTNANPSQTYGSAAAYRVTLTKAMESTLRWRQQSCMCWRL